MEVLDLFNFPEQEVGRKTTAHIQWAVSPGSKPPHLTEWDLWVHYLFLFIIFGSNPVLLPSQ